MKTVNPVNPVNQRLYKIQSSDQKLNNLIVELIEPEFISDEFVKDVLNSGYLEIGKPSKLLFKIKSIIYLQKPTESEFKHDQEIEFMYKSDVVFF